MDGTKDDADGDKTYFMHNDVASMLWVSTSMFIYRNSKKKNVLFASLVFIVDELFVPPWAFSPVSYS